MGWAGFVSMALFRLPLWLNKRIDFWKLMGSGKNGRFDVHPDWRQWALLCVYNGDTPENSKQIDYPSFIRFYWKLFRVRASGFILIPIAGHGSWDGKQIFGNLPKMADHEGIMAVLTRATIRAGKLRRFWQQVAPVAGKLHGTPGLLFSCGIGELPFIRQATFSIWQSGASINAFAYQQQEHQAVIAKTRQEQWYSEEMFVRFRVIAASGLPEELLQKICPPQPLA